MHPHLGTSSLNFGPTNRSATGYLFRSPTFTASWLSVMMNLLNTSIILTLLRSWRSSQSRSTGAVAPSLLIGQVHQGAKVVLSRFLRRCVRFEYPRIAGIRTVLYDQYLVRILPMVLAKPHAAHHQLHCFFPCFVETVPFDVYNISSVHLRHAHSSPHNWRCLLRLLGQASMSPTPQSPPGSLPFL